MQKSRISQISQAWACHCCCFVCRFGPARAADYPTPRSFKLVVPFARRRPDVLAALSASAVGAMGPAVIVETSPGASGGIGTRAAAKAERTAIRC